MIFGMTPMLFIHVALSLIGIATGFVVMAGLLGSEPPQGLDGLVSHHHGSDQRHRIPAACQDAAAVPYRRHHLARAARGGAVRALRPASLRCVARAYVVTALLSLYLNVFVLIVQAFQKVAPLKALAPTQTEQPFLIAQGVTLAAFGMAIVFAALRFRPAPSGVA